MTEFLRRIRNAWRDHEHAAENEEVVDMNVTVGWATINDEQVPVSGYTVRCKVCGEVYPVAVG